MNYNNLRIVKKSFSTGNSGVKQKSNTLSSSLKFTTNLIANEEEYHLTSDVPSSQVIKIDRTLKKNSWKTTKNCSHAKGENISNTPFPTKASGILKFAYLPRDSDRLRRRQRG